MTKLTIHTDGGSKGNPGPMHIGVVIYDSSGTEIKSVSEFIGEGTNNYAEYSAVVRALEVAKELGGTDLVFRSDSQLLVRQLNGEYKVRSDNIRPLYEKIVSLISSFNSVSFEWVPRENNEVADRLTGK